MLYLKLFWSFLQIGLFSIGGGYASMPLIQHQVVDINQWLTMHQFTDVITISQMTPGPVSVNSATFVGIQVGGIGGAIVATLGCILPSCVITIILAVVYYKCRSMSGLQGVLDGVRPAVVAMIAAAGLSILILSFWNGGIATWEWKKLDAIAVGVFAISLFLLRKWKLNPTFVMLGAGVVGICIYPFLPK